MLKFLDGPAAGVVLTCARAPLFLRVVEDLSPLPQLEWDALDQLSDKPKPHEAVHVYVKTEDHGSVHYDGRTRDGKRFGRTEQFADYHLFSRQPDDATARDNVLWSAWAEARAAELRREEGGK